MIAQTVDAMRVAPLVAMVASVSLWGGIRDVMRARCMRHCIPRCHPDTTCERSA
jgi:hypothetical protein